MNAVAVPRPNSLPIGVAVSIGLHLLLGAYVLISFSRPQPLAPPMDLSKAIAISMEPFRPEPPPEPPKPKPKPQTPKDVVTTTAPEPDASVAAEPEDSTPPPPQEASMGTPSAASYASIVAGILQRNKRYPKEALVNDIQGVVEAYFVINRQGHVIGYRIERASGERLLDQEVVRLLKYVKFPPIPADGGDPERREFSLPITFRIAD